jgi:HupE/UreJ protein
VRKILALSNVWNRRGAAFLLAASAVCLPVNVAAHDIPADSTVRMFVKPEGQRLHVIVRVPMASINDVDWPLDRGTGYLDLARLEPFLRDASTMWIGDYLDVYEGTSRLAYPTLTSVRLSTAGDTSFTTYEDALAHVTGPRLSEDTYLLSNQGELDVLFDYAIQSDHSRFSLRPRFDRFGLRVLTILRFLRPDGTIRAFEYEGGDRGLIHLDPAWHQTAGAFAAMGFRHVLAGVDHLLFMLCLAIPFRRLRELGVVATAFAVASSVTLIASAYGMTPSASWFPALIVALVAGSIIYVAVDNVIGLGGPTRVTGAAFRRRWIAAFAFGLVHGFGFSFALGQTLQFAGSHLLTSVISFDLGIEVGLVLLLAAVVPLLNPLFRFVIDERVGTIVVSALAAHTGWHWLTTRVGQLWKYQFVWPEMTPAFFADVLRWLMLAVAVAGVWWLGSLLLKTTRLSRSSTP